MKKKDEDIRLVFQWIEQLLLPVVCSTDIQHSIDSFMHQLLPIEKKAYHDKVIPFPKHAEQLKMKIDNYFMTMHKQLEQAQKLLKEQLILQDNRQWSEEASFSAFSNALQAMREKVKEPSFAEKQKHDHHPLQEKLTLSWSFMDHAYEIATNFFNEKQYANAQTIYMLLHFLNPGVFEYWFGEAACQHALGNMRDALTNYSISLMFQPENPAILFEIAKCRFSLKEKEDCLKTLEFCIEYGQRTKEAKPIAEKAKEMKRIVATDAEANESIQALLQPSEDTWEILNIESEPRAKPAMLKSILEAASTGFFYLHGAGATVGVGLRVGAEYNPSMYDTEAHEGLRNEQILAGNVVLIGSTVAAIAGLDCKALRDWITDR